MSLSDESLFLSVGLSPKLVKGFVKNEAKAKILRDCIEQAGVTEGCDPKVGKLIYDVVTNKQMEASENGLNNRAMLLSSIGKGDICTPVQLKFGIDYCMKTPKSDFDMKEFENISGVGVVVTKEEIESTVDATIEKFGKTLSTDGKGLMGKMLANIRQTLPFADGKEMNVIFNAKFNAALAASGFDASSGSKNNKKKGKSGGEQGKSKKNKKSDKQAKEESKVEETEEEVGETIDKYMQGRPMPTALNTEEQLSRRILALENKDIFLARFPPEPNGFLHIGHCKAMNFNFSLAASKDGGCYLRFDDTNPEAEDQEYIDNIKENVRWMGFKPWKITYSSDYFDDLYALAVKMIKDGNAYVCHQTKDGIEAERKSFREKKPQPSPWRDTSPEENLKKFELMRTGYYAEGEVSLRMKGDYNSPNPNMWDHIAYRIKHIEHPRTKDKWCIYPSYDFTHCIVDSLEWITASCCTLEFENRRESYFWLLKVLDLYKPVVWEYSRLNISGNVLSKRKLLKLVKDGYVRGWDDPRLYTINGLRRRGYTAEILRNFCDDIGVTRKDNIISPKKLESCARKALDNECSRAMAVSNPLKIILTNFNDNKNNKNNTIEDIECPNFPQDPSRGVHNVKLSKEVYIDQSDFKDDPNTSKKYFGLAPGKTVRLKYAYNITCDKVVRDEKGKVLYLECSIDPSSRHDTKNVKKGHLTWVSAADAVACEIRFYDYLFKVASPGGDDWVEQLNEESEIICNGLVSKYVVENKDERFQFERVGYFCKDNKDYTPQKPVFNSIVSLRDGAKGF